MWLIVTVEKQKRKNELWSRWEVYNDALTYYVNHHNPNTFCHWYKLIYKGDKDLNTRTIYDLFPEYANRATTPNIGNLLLYRNTEERIKALKQSKREIEDKLTNRDY